MGPIGRVWLGRHGGVTRHNVALNIRHCPHSLSADARYAVVDVVSATMQGLFRRVVFGPLVLGSASLFYLLRFPRPPRNGPRDSDHEMFLNARSEYLAQTPTKQLLRSLFVHAFCAHPHLANLGIRVMKMPQSQNFIFDSIVRRTFFAEFCGYLALMI